MSVQFPICSITIIKIKIYFSLEKRLVCACIVSFSILNHPNHPSTMTCVSRSVSDGHFFSHHNANRALRFCFAPPLKTLGTLGLLLLSIIILLKVFLLKRFYVINNEGLGDLISQKVSLILALGVLNILYFVSKEPGRNIRS